MLDLIRKISTGKTVLISLLLFILFTSLVLPWQARVAEEQTGVGDSPDTSFFYSSADLYRIAEEYGKEGRQAYIQARWTFDVIWPLVYLFFLVTGTSWFITQFASKSKLWNYTPLIPVAAAIFDYLENTATSIVMAYYPETIDIAAHLAPFFSAGKWILISLAFFFYFLELILLIFHKYLKTRNN
jgi:hypothetical protein